MTARISIVITSYNRDRFLSYAIASALQQTWTDFELLVWLDGCTDRSREIAHHYAQQDTRVRVIDAPHQGYVRAMKQAIAQTIGEYVSFLDDDDILAATALEKTAAVLDAEPDVGLVYTDYVDMDVDGKPTGYGKRCRIPYSKQRLLVDFMTFHFRLFRRSIYEQIGGLDLRFHLAQDYDLCLRLSEVTQIHHLPEPLYFYRNHPGSVTQRKLTQTMEASQQAIALALDRRGLSDRWRVVLENHQFHLRRKASLPLPSLPIAAKSAGFLLASVPLLNGTEAVAAASPPSPSEFTAQDAKFTAQTLPIPAPAPPEFLLVQAIAPAADGTNTQVTQTQNQFDISGGQLSRDGANLFHSFSRFGLDANQIANFLSNPQVRNVLGRVVGGDPSYINGLVRVTGGSSNLYLMNPAGIVFGANARLDVPGSFTATTADRIGFGNQWFSAIGTPDYASLVGNPTSLAFSASQPGAIVNAGNLSVSDGQSINLLGGTVVNTGTLTAPGGQIVVAAVPGTSRVRISQPGSPLSLEIQPLTDTPTAPLNPLSLPALLTGTAPETIPGIEVSNGSARLANSRIQIPLQSGTTIASGSIDASSQSGGRGGTVALLGDRVGLIGANVTASGSSGGTILVGGDYQGKGSVPNAATTYVDRASTLTADGTAAGGSGGRAIVWADDTTRFFGTIQARGGSGGAGGFAEVSGKKFLTFDGQADLSAPNGSLGTLLLDPENIVITQGGGYTGQNAAEQELPDIFQNQFDGQTVTIREDVLENLSGDANLVLEATNDIRVDPLTNFGFGGRLSLDFGSGSIAFRADSDGNGAGSFSMNTQDTIDTNGRSISISGASIVVGTIDTRSFSSNDSGSIVLNASNGSISASRLIASASGSEGGPSGNGGTITAQARGDVNVAEQISTFSTDGTGGAVNLTSQTGNVSATDITFGSTDQAGGALTVNAPGSVTFNAVEIGIDTGSADIVIGNTIAPQALTLPPGLLDTQGGNFSATLAASSFSLTTPILTSGGNFSLANSGSLQILESIATLGGNLTLSGSTIDSSAVPLSTGGGAATLTATGDVVTNAIQTDGGAIALTSSDGAVLTGNLVSSGTFGGGAVQVRARDRIQTGQIDSSASIGDGGSVLLDPENDIQVDFINAQGGSRGVGGNVDITTQRFFRAIDTFFDQQQTSASISTAGGLGGGTIIIRHGGGIFNTPFDVGDGSVNGTAGAITNGNPLPEGRIEPFRSFPGVHRQDQDRIQILTPEVIAPPENTPVTPIGTSIATTQLPCLDGNVSSADSGFSSEYEKYLGTTSVGGNQKLGDTCTTLATIEAETGIRPALVYLMFVPTGATGQTTPGAFTPQETDELEIILVTAKEKPVRKRLSGVTRSQVLKLAETFRLQVSDGRKTRTRSYRPSAEALYKLLIDPIAADLQTRKVQNIAFIADEGLRSIPYAALHDGQQFLIEQYSVGLMPSLSLTDTRYTDIRNTQLLAMGNSTFEGLNPLPAVPMELTLISQIWGTTPQSEESFTLANLKAQRKQKGYGIVHLATHGEFQPGDAANSYIQLRDTRVRLDQLEELGLNNPPAQLLVLSACRTALGDRASELGFAGIAVQSGSKSALGSLWYVSDAGTLALMSRFYKELRQVPLKAEALRQAQIAMLQGKVKVQERQIYGLGNSPVPLPKNSLISEDSNLAHPFYWSPFTMIGNPW